MDTKEKLINLMVESLIKADYSCEICKKAGFNCPVIIPANADIYFKPDFSKCNFKAKVYETLTIDN